MPRTMDPFFWRWSSWPPTDFDSWHLGSQHSCGFRDGLFHNMFSTPQVIILVHALWFFSVVLRACQDFPWRWALAPPAFMRYGACERKKGLPWHLGLNGCDTSWLWFPSPNHSKLIELNQTNQQNLRKQRYTEVSHGFIRFHDVFFSITCWWFVTSHLNILAEVAPVPLKTMAMGGRPLMIQTCVERQTILQYLKSGSSPCVVRPPDFRTSKYYFWKPNM